MVNEEINDVNTCIDSNASTGYKIEISLNHEDLTEIRSLVAFRGKINPRLILLNNFADFLSDKIQLNNVNC